MRLTGLLLVAVASLVLVGVSNGFAQQAEQQPTTFFVTSVRLGNGANLGGLAYADGDGHTCSNWTSSTDGQGGAHVGHHDDSSSWSSGHATPGCGQENLATTA